MWMNICNIIENKSSSFVFNTVKEPVSSHIRVYPTPLYYTGAVPNCILDTSRQYKVDKSTGEATEISNHEIHVLSPTQNLGSSKTSLGETSRFFHFKGGRTIKNLLVSPKDKDPMVNQSGAIYRYQCGDLHCDDEYIGETSRTFGERYKEHLKAPSAIHHHSIQTGHPTNQNNFQIVGREGHNLARNIKESIYIRVNNPSLNNNIGKFNLSHIWDRVLLNTKGLTLK